MTEITVKIELDPSPTFFSNNDTLTTLSDTLISSDVRSSSSEEDESVTTSTNVATMSL